MISVLLYINYIDSKKKYKLLLAVLYAFVAFCSNYGGITNFGECPHCFDEDLCDPLRKGRINLTIGSILSLIFNFDLSKSVFYGKWNDTDIVIKRLMQSHLHRDDFKPFAARITDKETQVVKICPGIQDTNSLFLSFKKHNLLHYHSKHNLWRNLKDGIEVMLLHVLPAAEGWPVPSYLGACGEFIAEDFRGVSLLSTYNMPWKARAFLARQLLRVADMFTFRHSNYSFYLTDLSPDNIAVGDNGSVTIIDLDNVVIVNRYPDTTDVPEKWLDIHTSKSFTEDQFEFSVDEICSRHISDHNYFAVCKHLLKYSELMKGGLLHGTPLQILEDYPTLTSLINECSDPEAHPSRIVPGQQLERLLEAIVRDFIWS